MRVDYINLLRAAEIHAVLSRHNNLFVGKDLLEIGCGTGAQLRVLAGVCKSATGIDTADSNHAFPRLVEIKEYDGRRMPFPDSSFDVIFSSNVIEHIKDEVTVHAEMHRVLRPEGVVIHIVPTASWRVWTSMSHYPWLATRFAARLQRRGGQTQTEGSPGKVTQPLTATLTMNTLLPARHGEFGNRMTEHLLFRKAAWRKRFEAHAWSVQAIEPVGFAYSGNSLLAERLSMKARHWLARLIGSSSVLFILRPR